MRKAQITLCIALALALAFSAPAVCATGCGLRPIKPITPLGCSDLVAQCQCDEDGKNCTWTWVCIPTQ
jgi:hypothetical protein